MSGVGVGEEGVEHAKTRNATRSEEAAAPIPVSVGEKTRVLCILFITEIDYSQITTRY